MFVITKDGKPQTGRIAEDQILREFHRLVGYSMDHATRWEGYAVAEVPDDIDTDERVIGRIREEGARNREWVTVRFQLRWEDGSRQTVDHDTVAGGWRFSASGMQFARRTSPDCHSCGQMLNVLASGGFEPVAPWTRQAVADLLSMWQTFHLNDMQAACRHQSVVWEDEPYFRPSLDLTPACPVSGYRYGSAWLYEPIPAESLATVRRLADVASRADLWEW